MMELDVESEAGLEKELAMTEGIAIISHQLLL
jgi:hypothetical protein